jgi:hypothetical protein
LELKFQAPTSGEIPNSKRDCHPERSEGSLNFSFQLPQIKSEMFRFAKHDRMRSGHVVWMLEGFSGGWRLDFGARDELRSDEKIRGSLAVAGSHLQQASLHGLSPFNLSWLCWIALRHS